MISSVITGLLFSIVLIFLSYYKAEYSRLFLGVFFLFCAVAVSIPSVITQPYYLYQYGMGSPIPFYRHIAESLIGINPILWAVFLIICEITLGLLILSPSKWVNAGMWLSALFFLLLMPLNYYQMLCSLSVPAIIHMARKNYEYNVFELVVRKLKKIQRIVQKSSL